MIKIDVKHRETEVEGVCVHLYVQLLQLEVQKKNQITPVKEERLMQMAIVCWYDEDRSITICPLDELEWLDVGSDLEDLADTLSDSDDDSQDDDSPIQTEYETIDNDA